MRTSRAKARRTWPGCLSDDDQDEKVSDIILAQFTKVRGEVGVMHQLRGHRSGASTAG